MRFTSDTTRTRAKRLSFYQPRLLYFLDQMLAVIVLSQHQVLSFKTVKPRAPYVARCIGHANRTWFAVCSMTPHWQFGKGNPDLHGRIKLPKGSLQAIDLNTSCSEQPQTNRPSIAYGYKSTDPGCNLTVLRVPFIIVH